MKLFTRLFLAGAMLLQVPALAATVTVRVGVNGNNFDPQIVDIRPGDQILFQWVSGTHPSQSDSNPPAFANFNLSATNPTYTTPAFNTVGSYGYHCLPHGAAGAPGQLGTGMAGLIRVSSTTPAQEATALAASLLNVYPNPVRGGRATVSTAELKAGQGYRLRVTNIIGREVRVLSLRSELLTTGQPLDLSGLPAGMYFCSLLQNDKVLSTKRVTLQN